MGEESCSFWTRTYGSHAPWNMAPDHLHCHWWQCFKRRMCFLSSSASMTWILQPFKLEVPVHSLHDQADLSHCLTFIWTHHCASHSLISYSASHRAATEWFHLITHWLYSTAPFPFSKCGSHLANPDPCYVHLVRWCCKSAILNMPEKMENSAVATRLEKVSFHSNPKERQCQRVLKLLHSWLISHASKVMLKILQGRLQQDVNQELPDIQAGFRKGRGTRDHIANICWIVEKTREIPEVNSIYFCFIDYAKAFDCVNHNKLWKILKEMGMPGYLTCLLRNLKVGQEATVRTRYEITDWFQIGKGVHQGCTLSPCFFTLYTE